MTDEELTGLERWTREDSVCTPACPWCDSPHITAARLIAEVRRLREELAEAVAYGEECLSRMGGVW